MARRYPLMDLGSCPLRATAYPRGDASPARTRPCRSPQSLHSLIGRGSGSGVRFACALKQDDAEQKRNDEWDGRDPDNEAGIGVPWRGESMRIGKVQTPDYQQ